MHRVHEEPIIEQTVPANGVKISLAVDQDRAMPRGHGPVGILERRQGTKRHPVVIAGRDVVPVSLVPGGGGLESRARRKWASANRG